MRSLFAFEIKKLLRERQLYLALALIAADLAYVYFAFTDPESLSKVGTPFANWLNSGTSDTAFILYFLGLATTGVFASDYSYRTFQNYVPYATMSKAWFTKIVVNLIALLALLLFWYAVAIVFAAARSASFDPESVGDLFLRMPTQYPHLAFNGGVLALVCVLARHRGIANVALVLSWLAYGFIPFAGLPVYAYVSHSIAWAQLPNAALVIVFSCSALLLYAVSHFVACKREVLV